MKTFSRRARKAQDVFGPDQLQSPVKEAPLQLSQGDQEDPYWLPEALPAPSPILKQASPLANKAPATKAPGRPSGSKRRAAQELQPAAEPSGLQQLLRRDKQASSKPRSGGVGGGKGSGRSVGSNQCSTGAVGRPAVPERGAAPASRSGRLLGPNKGSKATAAAAAAASPSVKRKASSPDSDGEVEAPSKKPRAVAAPPKACAVPASVVPLAAAPRSAAATAAAAAASDLAAAGDVGAVVSPRATLPVAMARLLNPAALRESAPAQTVMEAQELGEQARYRDDAMWALEGLCLAGSANTQRESAVALLDLAASRRGRLALRSGGVAEEILETLGKSNFREDAVLALGAAAILACFCQGDADPSLLAKQETAQLAAALLKVEQGVADSGAPASFAGRILKVLREGPFARLLPQEEATHPTSVVLAALAAVLDPNQHCMKIDPFKHALREAGALAAVAQLAAQHGTALRDVAPTMRTVRALWKLHKSLTVLENACFACPENESHLAALTVTIGSSSSSGGSGEPAAGSGGIGIGSSSGELGLVVWVVRQVELLGQQGLTGGFKKDCLRALLAVLMNVTQNNAAGCEAVVAAGVLEVVPPVLAQIAQGGPKNKGCIHDAAELEIWVDEVSCCLGLLINLIEHQQDWRQRLRLQIFPAPRQRGSGTPSSGSGGSSSSSGWSEEVALVSLLSGLLASVIPASRYDAAADAAAPVERRLSTLSTEEVTVEEMEASGEGGAASIVEVYTAILLGFLVEGCPQAREQAAALLPTGSLEPVAAAVRRCLLFYVSAGAMTKGNEESLRQLLASLVGVEGEIRAEQQQHDEARVDRYS